MERGCGRKPSRRFGGVFGVFASKPSVLTHCDERVVVCGTSQYVFQSTMYPRR